MPSEFRAYIATILWRSGVDSNPSVTPVIMRMQLEKELWQDPFIHDMYVSNAQGTLVSDPADPNALLTDANFEAAMKTELFDPQGTHNQFLVSQGIQLLQLSGKPLNSNQQAYGANLGGGNPAVLSAIAQAAQDTGVPYNVALAVAMAESGLNPNAHAQTPNEDSWGLFQLNTMGGEGQGMTQQAMLDPYTNAVTALRHFADVAAQHPEVVQDPGQWAATAQGADNSGNQYANRVNNLLQSGFGGAPSSVVPKPFDGNYPITKDFGADGFGGTEDGIDYGIPQVGTPIYSPFAGTIVLEDMQKQDWGKRVKVVLDNGYTFAVGHMSSFAVSNGQRVNPGDILGGSGGDPSDPSSGVSDGPHIEVQWISPGNKFLDPHPIMDQILTGNATFRNLNLTGAQGGGVSAEAAKARAEGRDPILEEKYPGAVNAFKSYFGRMPTATELQGLISRTGGDPNAIDSFLRTQPSHIAGLSMGVYNDIKSSADKVSTAQYGHGVTDGMVKELSDAGYTSPAEIQMWLSREGIEGRLDPKTYAALHQLNTSYMQSLANEPNFDPRIATRQYSLMQNQGITDSQIVAAANAATQDKPLSKRTAGPQMVQ